MVYSFYDETPQRQFRGIDENQFTGDLISKIIEITFSTMYDPYIIKSEWLASLDLEYLLIYGKRWERPQHKYGFVRVELPQCSENQLANLFDALDNVAYTDYSLRIDPGPLALLESKAVRRNKY